MPIRILSEAVAAQIAAGEVVERPASVVKELLENALDARASTVVVEVREAGRKLIRVSDDGIGIPTDEVTIAFHRHSTSKLSSAADLDAIHTLGFRGEALASIASVSQVTLVTRATGQAAGTRLRVEGGEIRSQEAMGAPQGTMVGVENLFYNVPARLKFLRSQTTEKRHIDALVTRYALAYPSIRFRLVHDNRLVFQSPGNGSRREVMIEVYGLETAREMLEIKDPEGSHAIRVNGFTSSPSQSRANRRHITLFINGRWVQDTALTYAVVQAYHTLLMKGRYPISVIVIEMPAGLVDVNVHPTKAEVRFRDKDSVFGAVQRAVRRRLLESGPIRPASIDTSGWSTGGSQAARAALAALQPVSSRQREMGLPGGTAGEHQEPPVAPELPGTPSSKLPMLRVIGQVGAAYIVAEGPAGMVVIDQHAAHERILYERFMAQRETGIATQTLLETAPVDLPPDRASLLEERLDMLKALGFMIEHFGGTTFLVRGLPA